MGVVRAYVDGSSSSKDTTGDGRQPCTSQDAGIAPGKRGRDDCTWNRVGKQSCKQVGLIGDHTTTTNRAEIERVK